MIRFEDDHRTRGEQFVLRAILQGHPLARCDWHALRADDFAHDLRGRIFPHAARLVDECIKPRPYAVFCSMRDECRRRALDGVTGYLEWLVSDDPCFERAHVIGLVAFLDAVCEQHEALAGETP
jgi:hypothetical protein